MNSESCIKNKRRDLIGYNKHTVYHGTPVAGLTLADLSAEYSVRKSYGPGVYFTMSYSCACDYSEGGEVIPLEIDFSLLIDGVNYDYRDIEFYRSRGYVGAVWSVCGLVTNVVIWNMDDVR